MYNTIHAKNPFLLYLKALRESVHAKESVHVPSVKQSFNVPDKIVSTLSQQQLHLYCIIRELHQMIERRPMVWWFLAHAFFFQTLL
jgi:hypothetical protein